ncbi:hypothetical protein ACFYTC_26610 [Actinomadura nitritigenes]|uniref:hypothetical protein n=1 Tax=Actinomadura nitritigenes TaxID=134602 RepID=UPI0036AF5A1A
MVDHETPSDERTELLAGEMHERARALIRLIQDPPGLTRPEAARTILGNLAQTAYRFVKLAEHLDVFLDGAVDAGRLQHERGDDPLPSVLKAHDALIRATEQSMDLAESFRRAQGALAVIQSTEATSPDHAETETPLVEQARTAATDVQSAARDFPRGIGDVLSDPGAAPPTAGGLRRAPQPPPPRREM